MKCELSIVKIFWYNFLFNKQLHKHFLKTIFDINYHKKTICEYKKDSIIVLVSMVGVTILSVIYNLNIIYFSILLFITALLNVILATYIFYKDVRPLCAPLCNTVGQTDFKRSIELTINEIVNENYKPTTERDIEITNKLRQLEKEMS